MIRNSIFMIILGLIGFFIGSLFGILLGIVGSTIFKGLTSTLSIEQLTMLSTTIMALSTVILVILTGFYAGSTYNILKEQRKSIKIAALEKKLEKVYSPLINAGTIVNYGNLEGPSIGEASPEEIQHAYINFTEEISKVNKNYGHLLDQDIIQKYGKLWNITFDDTIGIASNVTEREKYEKLIKDFNEDIIARKNKYKIELDKLIGNF